VSPTDVVFRDDQAAPTSMLVYRSLPDAPSGDLRRFDLRARLGDPVGRFLARHRR